MKKQRETDSIIRKENRNSCGNEYFYELTRSHGNTMADFRIPLYSVKVAMTDAEGRQTAVEIIDLFSDENKAISFFQRIVDNLATPIDLPYIIEDEAVK